MLVVCLIALHRSRVVQASTPSISQASKHLSLPPAGGSQGANCLGNTAGAATSRHRLVTTRTAVQWQERSMRPDSLAEERTLSGQGFHCGGGTGKDQPVRSPFTLLCTFAFVGQKGTENKNLTAGYF